MNRVLMTADTVGGVWTFARELSRALEPHGTKVLLACLGGEPSREQRASARRVSNLTLAESAYKLEWMEDPWDDVAASGDWLLDLANQFRPDIVHLNSFGHGDLAWPAPVVLTAHSCILSWWRATRGRTAPAEWNRYREQVQRSLWAADVVTAPSHAMRRALERNYGPGVPPVKAVPNGIDPNAYRPLMKEAMVLTAGRVWDEAKNAAAVARVAPRIAWPCYIAGDGQGVVFRGCEVLGRLSRETLAGWYARASIYCLPAYYEPFGLSPLEAGLSGCALVLGDIDSLREVWGDAALFVPPHDNGALAAALDKLIGDAALRVAMARRALERARWFTPERMVQGYLEAYRLAHGSRSLACAS